MTRTHGLTVAALAAAMVLAGCSAKKEAADLVLTNGNIQTQDEALPQAQAIAVKDGKIVFVGSSREAKDFIGSQTQVTDLAGKSLLPSIIDSHTHPGLIAFSEPGPDTKPRFVLPSGSKEEMFSYLRKVAKDNPELPFLMAGDWNERWFAPKGPHKKDLDSIFPKTPVLLLGYSGHSFWLNSAAMKMMGITEGSADLKPGLSYFVRDEHGKMTGWAKEFVLFPMFDGLFNTDPTYLEQGLAKYFAQVSSLGVTTLLDAGNFQFEEAVYKVVQKMEKEGKLPLRYEATHHLYHPRQLKDAVQIVQGLRRKYEGELLKINTIKIHLDGVNEINTGAMLEDFSNEKGDKGGMLFSQQELKTLMLECAAARINLHLHTIGDRATRVSLDAMQSAQQTYGGRLPIELTLSHLEVIDPADLPRFKQLGVHANFTPQWVAGTQTDGSDLSLGPERFSRTWPINSLIQAGANVTHSSDVINVKHVQRSDPFLGMQIGATRQEPSMGRDAPVFGRKDERASMQDMFKGYSINAARQLGIAKETGSLTVGKSADMMVLPADPFAIDVHEVWKLKPTAVYFKGRALPGGS